MTNCGMLEKLIWAIQVRSAAPDEKAIDQRTCVDQWLFIILKLQKHFNHKRIYMDISKIFLNDF